MVNPRSKGNFRRLEWVIVRVVNVEKENASIIRRACVFSMYFEEEEERKKRVGEKKNEKDEEEEEEEEEEERARTWRTKDCAHPLVQVIAFRSRATVRRWFQTDFRQFLLDAFCR